MRVEQHPILHSPSTEMVEQAMATARQFGTRWHGHGDHVVLDTDFDMGLHFLACRQAWRDDEHAPKRLHYLAMVPRFHAREAVAGCLEQYGAWSVLAAEMLEQWPCAVPGMHRLLFDGGAVILTLVLGRERQDLAQIEARVDAFVLNDAMRPHDPTWLSRLAAANAHLSWSQAHEIDRVALRRAGFVTDDAARTASFAPRWNVVAPSGIERRAIVIGAGLAGSAVSDRLCARGWQVTLIERHAQPAQEASGNLAGIFMPQLSRDDNPASRFSRAAFLFALQRWRELGGVGTAFAGEVCGALQAMSENRGDGDYPAEFARHVSAAEVAAMLPQWQAAFSDGAWLFEQGGWAEPGGVCRAMLAACGPLLHGLYDKSVARMEYLAGQWQVFDEAGLLLAQAPHVVLANGVAARQLVQSAALPLQAVRGQVTHVEANQLPELRRVVCGDAYVTPARNGVCSVGASYDLDEDTGLRMQSQHDNLERLSRLLPQAASGLHDLPLQGRAGLRCVAADRLPLVGALPDAVALQNWHGERLRDVRRCAGLHGLLGLASRGLTWAPLAAELLAAQMSGEPLPLERDLVATLDPARFALQQQRMRQSHIRQT